MHTSGTPSEAERQLEQRAMLELLRMRKADRPGTELFTGVLPLVDQRESETATGMQVAQNGGGGGGGGGFIHCPEQRTH